MRIAQFAAATMALTLSACSTTAQHPAFYWPVEGEPVAEFGGKISSGKSEGVQIKTTPGAHVSASADGQIAFARDFAPTGNLIVIDHEDGWHTVYLGLETILVDEGTSVQQGERIALLTQADPYSSLLTFEVRKNGEPVDPGALIKTRLQVR